MKDRNVITPPLHKEAEFGELYKRYKARFESFAVGYVQDRLIAEDVVTDAFIYYWENRSRLDADCNAAAYILTTIRHKCLNYLRALQVRMRVHNEVGDLQRRVVSENIRSLELCDPQHLFAGEIEKLVRDCMAEMPELTRQVFTARRIHGKSYREIAAECGITERRVETELEKALGKLREVLRDYLPLVLAAGVLERILRYNQKKCSFFRETGPPGCFINVKPRNGRVVIWKKKPYIVFIKAKPPPTNSGV